VAPMQQVIIVARESSLRTQLVHHLRQEGFTVFTTEREEKVDTLLSGLGRYLVLLGLDGLKREGIAILRMIRAHFPQVAVITINVGHQLDLSIEAMRLGAFDDFLIPFDIDGLMVCVRKAFNTSSAGPPKDRS
jgi:DNA-binding NtrC family response regulator